MMAKNQAIKGIPWYDGRGNISFATNDTALAEIIGEWADGTKFGPPICAQDLREEKYVAQMLECIKVWDRDRCAKRCFVAEYEIEEKAEQDKQPLDAIHTEDDIGVTESDQTIADEREMLEELPLPGRPKG